MPENKKEAYLEKFELLSSVNCNLFEHFHHPLN